MTKSKIISGALIINLILFFTGFAFVRFLYMIPMQNIITLISAIVDAFVVAAVLTVLFRSSNSPRYGFFSLLPYALLISAFSNYLTNLCFNTPKIYAALNLLSTTSLHAAIGAASSILKLLMNFIFIYIIIEVMQNGSLEKTNDRLSAKPFIKALIGFIISIIFALVDCVLFIKKRKLYALFFLFVLAAVAFGLFIEQRAWLNMRNSN